MPKRRRRNPDQVKVTSDNRWHDFKYRNEVPKAVLEREFDWLGEDEGDDGFFRYKGTWYHRDEFMVTKQFPGWDGYKGDSYFSGILLTMSPDGEKYRVGTYFT